MKKYLMSKVAVLKMYLTSSIAILFYCALIVSASSLYAITHEVVLFSNLYFVTAGISWAAWLGGALYLTNLYRLRQELRWSSGRILVYGITALGSNMIFTCLIFVPVVLAGYFAGLQYSFGGV